MGKPKKRQLVVMPTDEDATSCGSEDLHVEDSWVMVRKQKVTILIPPLPVTSQSVMPDPGSSQLQIKPRKVINVLSECSAKKYPFVNCASERGKSISLATENAIAPKGRKSPCKTVNFRERRKPNPWMGPKNSRVDTTKCYKTQVHRTSKIYKQSISFFDGGVLLQRRMRASSLERKLEKAGGLSCWQASLGLEQFINIFKARSINKFQLVNLTMGKLEMDADADGPRRKLMLAINCLCQPYCFQDLRVSCNRREKI